ncbi:hypothetical protein [Variovorax sp. HW608]|uniref:hypothetical protein n=1 Tax=Variovorax sp. HW608 TaxID=1034889 RepID=UPI0012FD29CC|nr:hypothetical protein [Variovorax sp. HW608]
MPSVSISSPRKLRIEQSPRQIQGQGHRTDALSIEDLTTPWLRLLPKKNSNKSNSKPSAIERGKAIESRMPVKPSDPPPDSPEALIRNVRKGLFELEVLFLKREVEFARKIANLQFELRTKRRVELFELLRSPLRSVPGGSDAARTRLVRPLEPAMELVSRERRKGGPAIGSRS